MNNLMLALLLLVPSPTLAEEDSTLTENQKWSYKSEVQPVVRAKPLMPRFHRPIEGRVKVSFTVGTDGNILKDSIKIVRSEPKGAFERSAIKAISKFKYRPKKVNDQAVPMKNQEWVFHFKSQ